MLGNATHPVMQQQQIARDGERYGVDGRIALGEPDFDLDDVIDNTPKVLAGIILGAVGTLVLLRWGGFRFSFGTNIGAGG